MWQCESIIKIRQLIPPPEDEEFNFKSSTCGIAYQHSSCPTNPTATEQGRHREGGELLSKPGQRHPAAIILPPQWGFHLHFQYKDTKAPSDAVLLNVTRDLSNYKLKQECLKIAASFRYLGFKFFSFSPPSLTPTHPHCSMFIPDLFPDDGSWADFSPSHLDTLQPCPSLQANTCQGDWWLSSGAQSAKQFRLTVQISAMKM